MKIEDENKIKPNIHNSNTALSDCHMVGTSDERKKSEMKVSTNWCVTIKHQRLSSIRIIFINYQTSELQCDYQSYIQRDNIGDAWDFNGITPIAPSGDFSGETLTGVWLCYKRLSQIGVSPS